MVNRQVVVSSLMGLVGLALGWIGRGLQESPGRLMEGPPVADGTTMEKMVATCRAIHEGVTRLEHLADVEFIPTRTSGDSGENAPPPFFGADSVSSLLSAVGKLEETLRRSVPGHQPSLDTTAARAYPEGNWSELRTIVDAYRHDEIAAERSLQFLSLQDALDRFGMPTDAGSSSSGWRFEYSNRDWRVTLYFRSGLLCDVEVTEFAH